VLTLGFAYPFTRAALERYKMRNTWYGDLQGRFEGSGWSLFIRGFPMWLAVLVPALAALAALLSIDWPAVSTALRAGGDVIGRIEKASPGFLGLIGLAVLALALAIFFIALLLPAFHAMVARWYISGIRFGEIAATSHLRTRDVYFVYLRFIGYLVAFAAVMLVGVIIALIILGTFAHNDSTFSEVLIVVMMVGTYVVSMLGLMTLYNATVTLGVWRLTANSIALSDTQPLGRVNAAGAASSPLGEGIADVLNLGGI
jgi:uncharacterized membrane protein YjgN (DUF898 family)